MEEKNLPVLKTFLWKCFGIGFLLTFAFAMIYLFAREPLFGFAQNMIGIEAEDYNELWFEFMTYAKIILIYFFLVPALALSCMCKCKCNEEE